MAGNTDTIDDRSSRQIRRLFQEVPEIPEAELTSLRAELGAVGVTAPPESIRAYAQFCSEHLAKANLPHPPEWVIHSCLIDESCFAGLVGWFRRNRS